MNGVRDDAYALLAVKWRERTNSSVSLSQITLVGGRLVGTLVAPIIGRSKKFGGESKVSKTILICFAIAILAFATTGCSSTDNANANNAAPEVRAAADNSEITTTTDASGVKTETRVFRDNPRVSKVVVTTHPNGTRTVRVYSKTGEEKVVDNVGDALSETGDAIASAAGFVADNTKAGLNEAGDKLEDAGDKTKSGVKEAGDKLEDVGDKTKSGAKTVGAKTADVSRTVADKTVEGAKKTGKAIKKVIP